MSSLDARSSERDLTTTVDGEGRLSWRAAIFLIAGASFLLWSGVNAAAGGLVG